MDIIKIISNLRRKKSSSSDENPNRDNGRDEPMHYSAPAVQAKSKNVSYGSSKNVTKDCKSLDDVIAQAKMNCENQNRQQPYLNQAADRERYENDLEL